MVGERDGETLPSYPWPENTPKEIHGNIRAKPHRIFLTCLKLIRRAKPDLVWIPFFKDTSDLNAISSRPELLNTLNQIFKDQLASDYNDSQRSLLHQADVILVCYDPSADTIVSYGSSMFCKKGSIPDLRYQVIHLGHMIVARGHEKKRLTPLTGVTMGLYGHSVLDLFRTEIVVLRSNNRYVAKIINEVPPIYRSDKLSENEKSPRLREVVKAIKWVDRNVFHSLEALEIGKPSRITHKFPDEVTIDGLENDEIVYLARISSIGLYALRIMQSAFKRKSVR